MVWAAPGGRDTCQKGGGRSTSPFRKVSRPPGAAQTPKTDDFRSVKKSFIRNPGVCLWGGVFGKFLERFVKPEPFSRAPSRTSSKMTAKNRPAPTSRFCTSGLALRATALRTFLDPTGLGRDPWYPGSGRLRGPRKPLQELAGLRPPPPGVVVGAPGANSTSIRLISSLIRP